MWCGVIGDHLIGPYIFPLMSGDIYANFLQGELPALLENVPLQTRRQITTRMMERRLVSVR